MKRETLKLFNCYLDIVLISAKQLGTGTTSWLSESYLIACSNFFVTFPVLSHFRSKERRCILLLLEVTNDWRPFSSIEELILISATRFSCIIITLDVCYRDNMGNRVDLRHFTLHAQNMLVPELSVFFWTEALTQTFLTM